MITFNTLMTNRIAPLMTMFFLVTYAVLNGVVLLEQLMGLTSFRPTLVIPRLVPLIGLVGSLAAMFLIAPLFSLVAVVTVVLLYEALLLRQLRAPWSDVRSGMFTTLAEWAAKRTLSMPQGHDRAWKPSLLVPVESSAALRRSYRFLCAIARPNGSVHVMGGYREGQRQRIEGVEAYQQIFAADGIFARVALVETHQFRQTLQTAMEVLHSAFFRPNILFLAIQDRREDAERLQHIVDHATENAMGVVLYLDNPTTALGREQVVNVWIRDQSPGWQVGLRLTNLDLTLLLAYQLDRNWHSTRLNLITVVADPAEVANGEAFFAQLIELGRMPRHTRATVLTGDLASALPEAPQADLTGRPLEGSIADWAEQISRDADTERRPAKPKKIPERSSSPTKTARGTSMGGAASPKERAAAGLNPVAGLDIALEDVAGLTSSGVTATVAALSRLIEGGDPNVKRDAWVPHRPARPEKSEGGITLTMETEFKPSGDQPTAIKDLVEGADQNERTQVLLGGVTMNAITAGASISPPIPKIRAVGLSARH